MTTPRPALIGLAPDGGVVVGGPRVGVDHQRHDIGFENGLLRAGDADHLDLPAAADAARPAHAGGIHDSEPASMPRQHRVNRVPRRPRHVADEDPLFTQ